MVNSIGGMPNFSPQMLAQMREKMFGKLDGNGDGSIDQAELQATPAAKNGKGPDLSKLLGGMDGDGDGSITKTEMQTGFQKVDAQMQDQFLKLQEAGGQRGPGGPGGGGKPDAEAVFGSLDANGDGVIDAEELQNAKAADTSETEQKPDLAALLGGFDSDGDGTISKTEMQAGFQELDKTRQADRSPPRPPEGEGGAEAGGKPDLASLLGGFDSDGDGDLTKAELLSGFEQLDARRTQDRVQQSMSYLLSLQEQQQAA